MKTHITLVLLLFAIALQAQNNLTPELLWQLGRVSPVGITNDGKSMVYNVTHYNAAQNTRSSQLYQIPLTGGKAKKIEQAGHDLVKNDHISPDDKHILFTDEVQIKKVIGSDLYPELKASNVYIFDNLNYRHWDTWEDGKFSHLFYGPYDGDGENNAEAKGVVDLMEGQPYDCPQMPFGGSEDYTWSPDSKRILYVTKQKYGTEYTVSTNTDIFEYDLTTKKTKNLTEDNKGYDTSPLFSKDGVLAYTQMRRDGYEADKNDIILLRDGKKINLTERWDETVYGFNWSEDGKSLFIIAPFKGTLQLFELKVPQGDNYQLDIRQVTDGQFNVSGVAAQKGNTLVVSRTDMNHATELYTVDLTSGAMKQLTHVNDEAYGKIGMSKIEKRMIKTTDGMDMLTWVIYPPNFDPKKKYPTLLYCQGGPQSALSQFYSFRWNFQLMAAHGYIVVAPNRRGMPGHGVKWNEDISKDWGGQAMRDYLSAIDELAKEDYVDEKRLGCVGASFGGYSAFYLAGHHEGRFKSFIAHDGLFNLRSFYGTTEELFFASWDIGGPYWDKENAAAQRSYEEFNPINYVQNWDTPILIIQGGKDFRVPIGQGLEAFQAAQLRGIKSKLLYFPDENHWVLNAQNALIWQKEFYKWLEETVK